MKKYKTYGNYVTKPVAPLKEKLDYINGWDEIANLIARKVDDGSRVFVMDLYPGVEERSIVENIEKYFEDASIIKMSDALYSYEKLDDIFRDYITEDRVFGYMTGKSIKDCFDEEKLSTLMQRVILLKIFSPYSIIWREQPLLQRRIRYLRE